MTDAAVVDFVAHNAGAIGYIGKATAARGRQGDCRQVRFACAELGSRSRDEKVYPPVSRPEAADEMQFSIEASVARMPMS